MWPPSKAICSKTCPVQCRIAAGGENGGRLHSRRYWNRGPIKDRPIHARTRIKSLSWSGGSRTALSWFLMVARLTMSSTMYFKLQPKSGRCGWWRRTVCWLVIDIDHVLIVRHVKSQRRLHVKLNLNSRPMLVMLTWLEELSKWLCDMTTRWIYEWIWKTVDSTFLETLTAWMTT